MREYGVSALTSAISERSPSSSRIVRIAFMPAVPPPMMRCRVAIVTDSSRTAGARSQTRLAWRLRLARRPRDVLWLARPSPRPREHPGGPLPRELAEPVGGRRRLVRDRRGRACLGAGRGAAGQVALEGLAGVRVVEHRPVGARDRAELAPHARVVEHILCAGRVDRDRADGAGGHAPPLGALRAGVGRVRGVPLEGRDADDRLRGLERARLHIRAGELAPKTTGALLGVDPKDVRRGREHGHRFLRSRFVDAPRSRRPMNSSSGIAAIVIPAAPPRAPSSTDTRDTVALSGASMTDRKSYGPSSAYWEMTRTPMRVTSAFTLRIQPGRSRSTLRPDSVSVLSMMYRATAAPPQHTALGQRSEVYHALSTPDASGSGRASHRTSRGRRADLWTTRGWGPAVRGESIIAPRRPRRVCGGETTTMTTHALRSRNWFGPRTLDGLMHRAYLRAEGFSDLVFDGRPVIGIANSWSELTNCNAHLRQVADAVKRGVWSAGGFPLEFPTISLGEILMKPTTMLFRNLMAMDVEECLRAYPLDAVVLLSGCDKTTPAMLMGAASADVPAIMVTGGPMLRGRWRTEDLGSGTDNWRLWAERRAGRLGDEDWAE